jgi:hypothetical protein
MVSLLMKFAISVEESKLAQNGFSSSRIEKNNNFFFRCVYFLNHTNQ